MTEQELELARSDALGLCERPVDSTEIDPDIHDRLGFDHSDGVAPHPPTSLSGGRT